MSEALQYFTISWLDRKILALVAARVFAGIYIDAIPGLSMTMVVSILIWFTLAWDVNEALCLMAGIFMGGIYGGARTAILLNIPGAPSATATMLDGYPLAQKGEAIGLSRLVSVIRGFIGILALVMAAPVVSDFALTLQSRDYMLLAILGILLVGSLALANIFGLTGIKLFTKVVECPRGVLIPLILLLSVVGAYAVNNSLTDVYWMLGFGIFGYFMKIYGY